MVFFYWQRRVMACGLCLISVLVLLSGPLWGAVAWSLALPLAASMLFVLHFVYLAKEPKVIDREEADAGNSQTAPVAPDCLDFIQEQISQSKLEVSRVQTLIQDAVLTLVNSFSGLSQEAAAQLQLAESLAKGEVGIDSHAMSFSTFVNEIANAMGSFVEKTVENSRLAMLLVVQMESIGQ